MIVARASRALVVVGLVAAMVWAQPARAHAQAQASTPANQVLTLSPTSINQAVQPGMAYDGSFQVINQGATGYNFKIYAAPYSVTNEDYDPSFVYSTPGAVKVSDWFTFNVTSGHVDPGKVATIKYHLKVPPNTPSGGYYAAAFAETQVPAQKKQGVTLNQRVGELFYMTVPGQVKQAGNIVSWDVPFMQEKSLTGTLRLQNSGGIHFQTQVNVTAKDSLGNTKFTLKTEKYLLPQTIRKLPINWDETPPIGLFKVGGTVTILGKTQQLPTRWVLVMGKSARITTAVILILLVLLFVFQTLLPVRLLRRRRDTRAVTKKPRSGGK